MKRLDPVGDGVTFQGDVSFIGLPLAEPPPPPPPHPPQVGSARFFPEEVSLRGVTTIGPLDPGSRPPWLSNFIRASISLNQKTEAYIVVEGGGRTHFLLAKVI